MTARLERRAAAGCATGECDCCAPAPAVRALAKLQRAASDGRLDLAGRDRLRRILRYNVPEDVQTLLDVARKRAVEPGWYITPSCVLVLDDGEHEIRVSRRPKKA